MNNIINLTNQITSEHSKVSKVELSFGTLQDELITHIFSYLKSEDLIVMLNPDNFERLKLITLKSSPFLNFSNLLRILFQYPNYQPESNENINLPILINEKHIPVFSQTELITLNQFQRQDSKITRLAVNLFAATNSHCPKLIEQIVMKLEWDYELCKELDYTKPLTELCTSLLDDSKEIDKNSINTNPYLYTALFKVEHEYQTIADIIQPKFITTDWSSKIDVLVAINQLRNQSTDFSSCLINASDSLKKDKDVILAAMSFDMGGGSLFQFLDDGFKKDKKFILEVMNTSLGCLAFKYIDKSLKNDKVFIMEAIEAAGITGVSSILKACDDELRNDKEFVINLMNIAGLALDAAHPDLKKDIDVVLAAVNNHGHALQYADDTLRMNKEVVLAAVKRDGGPLKFVHESLKTDEQIASLIHKYNNRSIKDKWEI